MLRNTMADNRLSLFCLVDEEPTSNAFTLSMSATATVGGLKKVVKAEKALDFEDVDANDLAVWRVSIPVTDDDDEVPISLSSFGEKNKLGPATRNSKVFSEDFPEETIHIIVQRPPPGRAPVLSRVLAPLPGSLSDGSRPSLSFDAPQHRA